MNIQDNTPNSRDMSVVSETSAVELLAEYAPLVKSRALTFLNNECELEDLIQEGNIGLLFAFMKYKSDLSSFSTFARRCIDASIIDYLRKSSKLSHVPDALVIGLDDVSVADSAPDPEYFVAVKEEYSAVIKKAESLLSKLEFAVFTDILRGYTYEEIAKKSAKSLKSVNNTIQRIRKKLK